MEFTLNGSVDLINMLLRIFCTVYYMYVNMRKATESYRTYLSLVKLQPWFLSLQWKSCLWIEL